MDIIVRLADRSDKELKSAEEFLVEVCAERDPKKVNPFIRFNIDDSNYLDISKLKQHSKRRVYKQEFSFAERYSTLSVWKEGVQRALDTAKKLNINKVIVLLDFNFAGKTPSLFSDTNVVLDKDAQAKLNLWGQYGIIQPMVAGTVYEELLEEGAVRTSMIALLDNESDYEAKSLEKHIELSRGNSKRENIVNDSTIHFTTEKYGGTLLTNDKDFLKRAKSVSKSKSNRNDEELEFETGKNINTVTTPDNHFDRYEYTQEELEKVLRYLQQPDILTRQSWMYISKEKILKAQ